MNLYINSESFNPEDKTQVSIFRILCNLEISSVCRKWAKNESFEEYEKIIAIALCHASLGEAMSLFQNLVASKQLSKNEDWKKVQ